MGSYDNQENIEFPFPTERWPNGGKVIGIDRCIVDEIKDLWASGVQTVESCCGHNITTGYIIVKDEFIKDMIAQWYKNDPTYPDRPDIFLPKTK